EADERGTVHRLLVVLTDLREVEGVRTALARKADEAEEASEAKSRFLAAMSHEIRTPMNAILGFAQLLELSGLDETRQSHVRAIISAGTSMMNLLTDLLDLSRVEAGHLRLEERLVDLPALVRETVDWWGPSARDKGLELTLDVDPDLPSRILSDPTRIQQVLNNYLGNAVKFTDAGWISVSAGLRESADGHERLHVRVADTGPGIAPEDIGRLFRPFVQLETDSEKPGGGWGLGLSICANIAEVMGGAVGVERQPNGGAAFWLDLPIRRPAERAGAPRGPVNQESRLPAGGMAEDSAPWVAAQGGSGPGGRSAPPQPARRVLLAEDNTLNQDVMRRILLELGHEVSTVANGFEVLEALERETYDVVIMDVMMPGLDGLEATRRLRGAPHDQRDIPVIACSAHITAEAEDECLAVGMTAFLTKPLNPAQLAATIAKVTRDAGPVARDRPGL
ncbi:MAG: response regulator, partial [Pseudomonadota bacterium]